MFGIKKKDKVTGRSSILSTFGRVVCIFAFVSVLSASVMTVKPKETQAFCITVPCWMCGIPDCLIAALIVIVLKAIFAPIIEDNLEDHVNSEQNWIMDEFYEDYWVVGMAELSEFLVAFSVYQVEMVGTFFDAKEQLETKRLFNQMSAEAHKDYHPSEDLCWFGTNSRSLAATERRSEVTKLFLNKRTLNRYMGAFSTPASGGEDIDYVIRWRTFVTKNCDPKDNAWHVAGSGLDFACDHDGPAGAATTGALDPNRMNRDIDFTRMIDEPRTLGVNFSDVSTPTTVPPDEEDILAMSSNLYGNKVLTRDLARRALTSEASQKQYLALRSVIAKRSVAMNSFNAIVALKSEGTNGVAGATPPDVGRFMAAVIRDLMPGAPVPVDADVYSILGRNPSYYAQLEFLAKKIYQSPQFFANLYDKPVNVDRKSVAMKAVELMLDRALYESELRQEMILSVLLSSELTPKFREVNKDLSNTKGKR